MIGSLTTSQNCPKKKKKKHQLAASLFTYFSNFQLKKKVNFSKNLHQVVKFTLVGKKKTLVKTFPNFYGKKIK